jgi:hypothetical protein
MSVFWEAMAGRLVERYQCFGGTCCMASKGTDGKKGGKEMGL